MSVLKANSVMEEFERRYGYGTAWGQQTMPGTNVHYAAVLGRFLLAGESGRDIAKDYQVNRRLVDDVFRSAIKASIGATPSPQEEQG